MLIGFGSFLMSFDLLVLFLDRCYKEWKVMCKVKFVFLEVYDMYYVYILLDRGRWIVSIG